MSEATLTVYEPTSLGESFSEALLNDRQPSNLAIEDASSSEVKAGTAVVGSFEREEAFLQRIAQIRDYASLSTNWDTYGGLPVAASTIEFSLDLLTRLQVMPDISAPHVSPISRGVYLEWRFGDSNLYFEIEEDSILYRAQGPTGTLDEGEDRVLDVARAIDVINDYHRTASPRDH